MTQQGFWRDTQPTNQRVVVGGYGAFNNVWYILPQGGGGTLGNPKRNVFSNFTDLAPNLRNRDLIILGGVLREQALAPLGVFDVTIMGGANLPRQATNSGVPTGGGAYWTFPSATTPVADTALLNLREQGWTVQNIAFTPYTSSPCIQGTRAETATYPDPSHLLIDSCLMIDGTTGVGFRDSGGCSDVVIQNCRFQSLATAIKGIAGAGIADCLSHQYLGNFFNQNTNDIVISCSYGIIQGNRFKNTTTKKVSLTAGGHEIVVWNFFDDLAADIDPAHGYDGSATGTWSNYTTNQAALQVGQPA